MGSFSQGGKERAERNKGAHECHESASRVFIQISRHSIKQSICSGFASARTSPSACDLAHVQIRRDPQTF